MARATLEDFYQEQFSNPIHAVEMLQCAVEDYNEDENLDEFIRYVNLILKHSNITKLAKELNISRVALSNIVNNKSVPKIKTFQSILKILGYQLSINKIDNTNKKVA